MTLFPLAKQKFFGNNGEPLVGGLVFTYAAGTTTPIATASNQGGTPNTNPIVLDFRGECDIWGDPSLTYKLVLAPPDDTTPPTNPIWSVDNISLPGSGGTSPVTSVNGQIGDVVLDAADVGSVDEDSTIITVADETAAYPNSRQLLAGTNVTLDISVSGEMTINAATTPPDPMDELLAQARFSIKDNRVASNALKPDGLTITALTSGTFVTLSPATNLLGSFQYAVDTSPSGSADRQAAYYGTQPLEYVYKNTSGSTRAGGYRYFSRCMWLTAIAQQRAFGGLGSFAGSIMNQTEDPSSQLNCAFIGKDSADSNLFFMHNDGAGSCTKVDSGVAFSTLIGHILDLTMSCDPNGTTLVYTITDRSTGTVLLAGTASSNLPAADVGLLPAFIANTGSQTSPVEIGYQHCKLITNF